MYCPECGTENNTNKFCINCGTELNTPTRATANTRKATTSNEPVLESNINLRFGRVGWPKKAKVVLYNDRITIIYKNGGLVLDTPLNDIEKLELTGMNRVLSITVNNQFYGLDFTSIKRAAAFGAFGAVGALAGMASDPSKNIATYWKSTIEQLLNQ